MLEEALLEKLQVPECGHRSCPPKLLKLLGTLKDEDLLKESLIMYYYKKYIFFIDFVLTFFKETQVSLYIKFSTSFSKTKGEHSVGIS